MRSTTVFKDRSPNKISDSPNFTQSTIHFLVLGQLNWSRGMDLFGILTSFSNKGNHY